jgi:ABC-type multidrug transport system fused ATPase/permease subunit
MMFYMSKIMKHVGMSAFKKGAALKVLGGITEETLSAIKVVSSFGREAKELEKFKKAADDLRVKSQSADKAVSFLIAGIRFFIFGIYAISFFIGGHFIKNNVQNLFHDRTYDASILITVVMSLVTGLMSSIGIMPNV